jgi:hypothetical protein
MEITKIAAESRSHKLEPIAIVQREISFLFAFRIPPSTFRIQLPLFSVLYPLSFVL